MHVKGCRCAKCGLNPIPLGQAELHHRNPRKKAFTLDIRTLQNLLVAGNPIAMQALIAREAKKCDLLCKPCHAKVHETLDVRHFDKEYLDSLGHGTYSVWENPKLDIVA